MKKILTLLLAVTLVVGSLAACKRNEPVPDASSQPDKPATVYTDGTYSVVYSVPALDRTLDYMTVTVANDVFTIDDYGMKESGDMPVVSDAASADAAVSEAPAAVDAASGDVVPTEHEATAAEYAKDIQSSFESSSKIEDMEIIEGAEEHTYRFQRMMRVVNTLAKAGEKTSETLGRYADGSYESTMPSANLEGWTEFVKVSVKDGEVSTMDYNAMMGDDAATLITEDTELNKADPKPSDFYPQIVKNFTEAGDDLTKMLAPTGGGEATKNFSKLMKPLLVNMVAGGETKIAASRYTDGEYKAQFKDFDQTGWKEFVVLNIKNGEVTIKEFDAISKADETKLKSEDNDLAGKMEEKTGMTFSRAVDKLIESLAGAKNDVTKVDNVAGATMSSNGFKLLVGQILATTAVEGDNNETLIVEPLEVK